MNLGSTPEPRENKQKRDPRSEQFEELEQLFEDLDLDLRDELEELKKIVEHPIRESLQQLRNHVKQKLNKYTPKKAEELAKGASEQFSKKASSIGSTISSSIESATRRTKSEAERFIRAANERIGTEPGERSGVVNEILRIAPVVGAYQDYADGWRAWHKGQEVQDQDLIAKGRELCVSSWLNAGFDVGTLGTSFLAKKAGWMMKVALGTLTASKTSRLVSQLDLDPFKPIARFLLSNERLQGFADSFLASVLPKEEKDPVESRGSSNG